MCEAEKRSGRMGAVTGAGGEQRLIHRIGRPLWGGDFCAERTSEHGVRARHGDIWGRMGPGRGACEKVMGDAGGETARGRLCHSAVTALSWLPFYR